MMGARIGRFLATASLLAASVSTGAYAAATAVDRFEVGGTTIEAPTIAGFNEISVVSPEMVELARTMIPPANRLLGVYLNDADYEKLALGEAPDFDRYIFVQVHRELENTRVSREDFEAIASQLKAQQDTILADVEGEVDKLFDSASSQISENYDVSMDMQLGEQKSLGVFIDQSDAVAFTSLVKYQGSLDGERFDYVMAGTTTLLRVNKRLLYVYVYSRYESGADVAWVEDRTGELANLLLTANPPGPESGGDMVRSFVEAIDFGSVVNTSIIGAIVGGFVALMFVLFGGSKRRAEKGR